MIGQKSDLKSQSQSSKARTGPKERYCRYSVDVIRFLGSLPEKRAYWMGLLKDALNVTGPEIDRLSKHTDELSRIFAASLLTMENRT